MHFIPYHAVALTMAAVAGAGSYTFAAFTLSAADLWIHVLSTIFTVLRRKGSFVVSFALGYVSILMTGCWAALQRPPVEASGSFEPAEAVA